MILTGMIPLCFTGLVAAIDTDSLLDEMTDLRRLTRLPDPAYITRQFSSYDRKSKTPGNNDWFANRDRGQYLRVEENNGRKEFVMMDADGPGVIFRIWSANPQGTLRIYIDGNEKPALEANMQQLLKGEFPGLPQPLAGVRARGWNLYFPIAYAKHCKVTSDKGDFYYLVNYRTYAPGTSVTSFTANDIIRLKDKITNVAQRLSSTRAGGGPPADRKKTPFDVTLNPGQEGTLSELSGSKAICGFLVHLDAKDLEAAARSIVAYMTFDGEQTVECPIGDFFGVAPGLIPYASLPLGITKDKPQDMWCHWWMPFSKSSKITIKNLGDQQVRVHGAVARVPNKWDESTLLFHAKWRIERDIPTRPLIDWPHLECKGKGRFVGGMLNITNPVRRWWGEGDEKIYVDGESFPSFFGTGTEDYYGYAWCSNQLFVHAYHNQPRCDGPGNYGHSSVNRFHIVDDIPFNKSFKFDIENFHHVGEIKVTRAAVSYWYARPGCTDFFKPITKEDLVLPQVPPYQVRRVKGAIEGEGMKIIQKSGNARPQDVARQCSNDRHLWWTDGKPGDKLVLGFDVKKAGSKKVIIRCIKAHDFAKVQMYINGQKAGRVLDLYCANRKPTKEIDLGTFDLKKGQNTLTIEIVGANEKAAKAYMASVDYLLLK